MGGGEGTGEGQLARLGRSLSWRRWPGSWRLGSVWSFSDGGKCQQVQRCEIVLAFKFSIS